jgi:predicted transcriptional regulator
MALTLNGNGSIQDLVAGGLPDATVTQAELATGVGGTGPAFSAYQSSSQTVTSNTFTKVQFQSKEFDTSNAFDNTTNYRFTPQVSGYYQVTVALEIGVAQAYQYTYIYKNGGQAKRNSNGSSAGTGTTCTALIYLNGSTDYLEGYAYIPTTSSIIASVVATYFQATLVRAA